MSEDVRRRKFFLILSFGLHVVLVGALLVISFADTPERLDGDVDGGEMVQVAMLESSSPSPPQEEAPPPPPEPEPTPPPQPTAPPATPRPTPVPATPAPTATPPPATPAPTATPRPTATPAPTPRPSPRPTATPAPTPTRAAALSPDAARELRPAPTPRSPDRSPANTPVSRTPTGGGGPSSSSSSSSNRATETTRGATTLKGIGLPSYYAREALDRLARNFNVPPDQQRDVEAVLSFRISRNGTISNIRIRRSSGDSSLDQLARRALETTRSFAPFPDGFDRPHADVEVTFHFRQGS